MNNTKQTVEQVIETILTLESHEALAIVVRGWVGNDDRVRSTYSRLARLYVGTDFGRVCKAASFQSGVIDGIPLHRRVKWFASWKSEIHELVNA